MKSRTIRKTIIIFALIVLICLLSNGTGYYYPLAGKKDATQYYALEKHNQAIISWNHSNPGISNVSFDRSYQRIANILVIDGGTLIGIGFGKLAICIDSELLKQYFYLEELFFHSKKVFIIRYFKRIAMIKVIMF